MHFTPIPSLGQLSRLQVLRRPTLDSRGHAQLCFCGNIIPSSPATVRQPETRLNYGSVTILHADEDLKGGSNVSFISISLVLLLNARHEPYPPFAQGAQRERLNYSAPLLSSPLLSPPLLSASKVKTRSTCFALLRLRLRAVRDEARTGRQLRIAKRALAFLGRRSLMQRWK